MLIYLGMDKAFEILEISKIYEEIHHFIKTTIGGYKLDNLKPFHSKQRVVNELNKLDEVMKIVSVYGDIPLTSNILTKEEFDRAKKGSYLDEITLNNIKTELLNVKEILRYFLGVTFEYPNLQKVLTGLKFLDSVYVRIDRTIDAENKVKDSASTRLKELREKLSRIDKEIRKNIVNLMSKYEGELSGSNYVIRDGRFVLPINTSKKASVDGVIHDISTSGQTTFIEPTPIVNLENEKQFLLLEEREEVNRILKDLTNHIIKYEDDLINNNNAVGELDLLLAKAKYSRLINATIPNILDTQEIKLYQARHPLLNQDTVVPNDFVIADEQKLMLISGPNAGGKTIALKTVATLAYMVKLGLALPVSEGSSIGFFNKIYIDIGDNQSLEGNLSTFSAHITNLTYILRHINENDFVIIDELGNGTDPKEGDVLSIAIAKYLLSKKCVSMITSHFPLLKKYGLSNKKIVNASFIFDEEKIEPTFRMLLGVSGKSYGFLISKKYGLPSNIIYEAKKIYQKNYVSEIDVRLDLIDEKERKIADKELSLSKIERDINTRLEAIEKKEKSLKSQEEKLKLRKIDDFDKVIDDKLQEMDDIYQEFLENKKENFKKAENKIADLGFVEKHDDEVRIDDFVHVDSLGAEGKVVRIKGEKITFITDAGFSLTTTKDNVRKIEPPKEKLVSKINVDKQIMEQKVVSTSLNLIGYHIDEAIPILDKYLDDCLLKKFAEVKIIHGYGTGQLKRAIHEHLKTKKFVKSFQLGGDYDGGTGSTLVRLK